MRGAPHCNEVVSDTQHSRFRRRFRLTVLSASPSTRGLHSYPMRRYDVVSGFVSEPSFRCYDYFIGICVEPCTTPEKSTAGDDVIATQAHQLQVVTCLWTGANLIQINCRVWELQPCLTPFDIVGKNQRGLGPRFLSFCCVIQVAHRLFVIRQVDWSHRILHMHW
jgi:hypothetical protein